MRSSKQQPATVISAAVFVLPRLPSNELLFCVLSVFDFVLSDNLDRVIFRLRSVSSSVRRSPFSDSPFHAARWEEGKVIVFDDTFIHQAGRVGLNAGAPTVDAAALLGQASRSASLESDNLPDL